MPCSRPFQPISSRYKASKWSLRGSLLIETKCYGIDLFRESCSPYIKAIRACLLNTSEICSTGWSPLFWYKFTADLSTHAVMLLFHLKESFPWPQSNPSYPYVQPSLHAKPCAGTGSSQKRAHLFTYSNFYKWLWPRDGCFRRELPSLMSFISFICVFLSHLSWSRQPPTLNLEPKQICQVHSEKGNCSVCNVKSIEMTFALHWCDK